MGISEINTAEAFYGVRAKDCKDLMTQLVSNILKTNKQSLTLNNSFTAFHACGRFTKLSSYEIFKPADETAFWR